MNAIRCYWVFFKSTFTVSFVFSLVLSLTLFPMFFTLFPIALMTGGPVVSLCYRDIFRRDEYYFFYNRGISRISLLVTALILHILFGIMVLLICRWGAFSK